MSEAVCGRFKVGRSNFISPKSQKKQIYLLISCLNVFSSTMFAITFVAGKDIRKIFPSSGSLPLHHHCSCGPGRWDRDWSDFGF